jgi:hypothetical protein
METRCFKCGELITEEQSQIVLESATGVNYFHVACWDKITLDRLFHAGGRELIEEITDKYFQKFLKENNL